MKSRLCEMFGIEVPIFGFSHCRDVVVEVSKSGGFGVLGGGMDPADLERELRWIDANIGGRPYGIDFLMPQNYVDVQQELALPPRDLLPIEHRRWLECLLLDHEIGPFPASEIAEFQRIQLEGYKVRPDQNRELLEVAFAHPIKLVATALGEPPPGLVQHAHELGVKVAALVGSPEHAARQQCAGVDLIVAQGTEAGGHTGMITTMVLVPQVVDQVAPLPVVAAGGIASGRQMAAALSLGAEGVWCGTVWLTTAQSGLEEPVKRKILAAKSSDAVLTKAWSGKNNRVLRSAWIDAWAQQSDAPKPLMMPMQSLMTREAMQRSRRVRSEAMLSSPAGQVIGQIRSETNVREVVYGMLSEFAETMERMRDFLE